jgi:bacterioferritin (cytochrome b1)
MEIRSNYMTLNEMIATLNEDLKNEKKHLLFYLYHSSVVVGPERLELKEFLTEQAKSELGHVQEFSDLIIGLGGMPTIEPANPFVYFFSDIDFDKKLNKSILESALQMEQEVVQNYAIRIEQAQAMDGKAEDKKYIEIFLEDQLKDSRKDVDNIRQLLKGM